MRKVTVRVPGGTYPVLIGPGALEELPVCLDGRRRATKLHVVVDRRVAGLWGRRLEKTLERTGLRRSRTVLPSGEATKSVQTLERVWRAVIRDGADRGTLLVAFGGGVVGDITGFAAASVLRGIRFLQVPTTLLAMVDASVGGKTGVNLPEGKNLIGAFHQPEAVVMDLDTLRTLAPRQVRSGWAEVVKTAAIRDASLFGRIERNSQALLEQDPALLGDVVARCVRIKAAVVEADEREAGQRMVLNFGHTLGHAIEAVEEYRSHLHGEAVAMGMVFAARLGERLGRTAAGTADRLSDVVRSYGLPVALKGHSAARLISRMARDKKRGPGGLRWVLLPRVGAAEIVDNVPAKLVSDELSRCIGEAK